MPGHGAGGQLRSGGGGGQVGEEGACAPQEVVGQELQQRLFQQS